MTKYAPLSASDTGGNYINGFRVKPWSATPEISFSDIGSYYRRLQANVSPPLKADKAAGNTNTQQNQRSIVIGETIPIVFTRRQGTSGGVMLQPGATEAAFSVNGSNAITAKYHLVLSEGQLAGVQRRDVMQIGLRRGSFSQTYNKRAGSWTPGNTIPVPASGNYRVASYNCGGGSSGYGTYVGLSTFTFSTTCPDGDDSWKGQVSLFIRGGLQVTRLADATFGPSSNVVDLIRYLLTKSSRVPGSMVDSDSLAAAATFIDVNQFRWDGVINESTNLRDWLAKTLPYFLLREATANGKFALKPLVPITSGSAINTGAITPAFTFKDSSVIAGSFEIEYIPLSDRKPVALQMQWRQQDECQWPLVRTSEVRYRGEAEAGPYEQHDLSAFATSEDHVIKAGTYILARRRYCTHTARVSLLPGSASRTLVAGDVIQLYLTRDASTGSLGAHNRLYEVQAIRKEASGALGLDLLHFPVDSQGRSLVARDVAAASGTGLLLDPNTNAAPDDYSCDDNTVPADDSLPTSSWDKIPESYFSGGSLAGGLESIPEDANAGASDPLGDVPRLILTAGTNGSGEPQTTIQIPDSALEDCPNSSVQWLKGRYIKDDGTIMYEAIAGEVGTSLIITGALYNKNYTAVFTCDGSNPIASTNSYGVVTPGGYVFNDYQVNLGLGAGYALQLRYRRVDLGITEPAIVATTYGAYGVDGPSGPAAICRLWITNSSGVKEETGAYFGSSFGNDPAKGPFLIYEPYGLVPVT